MKKKKKDLSFIEREGRKERGEKKSRGGKSRKKYKLEGDKMEESMTGLNRLLFLLNGVLHISPNVHSLI